MALPIVESTGEIDTFCRQSEVKVGDKIPIVFRADCDPPFQCKVKSPSNKVLVERVLRELPTGKPQSADPVVFTAIAAGDYTIEIKQIYGDDKGEATLRVPEKP